jgi:hypothetical protein
MPVACGQHRSEIWSSSIETSNNLYFVPADSRQIYNVDFIVRREQNDMLNDQLCGPGLEAE